jgi:hypothetical protein
LKVLILPERMKMMRSSVSLRGRPETKKMFQWFMVLNSTMIRGPGARAMRAVEAKADAATETTMKHDLKTREDVEREGGSWEKRRENETRESINESDAEVDANS